MMVKKSKLVYLKCENLHINYIQNKYLKPVFTLNTLQDFFSSETCYTCYRNFVPLKKS